MSTKVSLNKSRGGLNVTQPEQRQSEPAKFAKEMERRSTILAAIAEVGLTIPERKWLADVLTESVNQSETALRIEWPRRAQFDPYPWEKEPDDWR